MKEFETGFLSSSCQRTSVKETSSIGKTLDTTTEPPKMNVANLKNGVVHTHGWKRKLKSKLNNLKKTKIALEKQPQSFVHVTKTVRVKCRTTSTSRPQVHSIMKYRF